MELAALPSRLANSLIRWAGEEHRKKENTLSAIKILAECSMPDTLKVKLIRSLLS